MRHAETPAKEAACPVCQRSSTAEVLAEARWYPFWERADGGCPACVQLARKEAGLWTSERLRLERGEHAYKFLLDGDRWLDDPANPRKAHDGRGGFNSIVRI